MNLSNQRHLFDLPEEVIYLNCANMSPLLKSVSGAGTDAINSRKHPWNIKSMDWFNRIKELRSLSARIINAQVYNIRINSIS